jgi:outer membrane lipoprotein-sorting protein
MKFLVLLLSFASFTGSESVNEALQCYQKFKKTYSKEKSYSLKISKGVYLQESEETINKNTIQLYIKGDKTRQESINELVINDGQFKIIANHSIKTILIQKVVKAKKQFIIEEQFSKHTDSLISWASRCNKDESDDQLKYHLFYNEGPFTKIHMAYAKKNGLLQSISFEPLEGMRKNTTKEEKILVRVAFSNYIPRPKFTDDLFNIQAYIQLNKKNEFIPVGLCSGYKILNN